MRFFDGTGSAHITSLRMLLSLSDVGIGTLDKKIRVVSPPLTVPPLMADVDMKDVVTANGSETGTEMSSAGRKSHEQLEAAMKSALMVPYVPSP